MNCPACYRETSINTNGICAECSAIRQMVVLTYLWHDRQCELTKLRIAVDYLRSRNRIFGGLT